MQLGHPQPASANRKESLVGRVVMLVISKAAESRLLLIHMLSECG